jgi:3-ketosteroid 9alpha-monooxygenase subunit B
MRLQARVGYAQLHACEKHAEVEISTNMQPDTALPPAKRIKDLEVMVADVIVETPDTSTLVLFTGNDRLDYKAGHFLTIDPHQFEALDRFTSFLEHLKGKPEPPRAYSMCSAPHERYLAVTVKEERFVPNVTKYPPLLSPLLVKRTVRGMRLVVTGFTGPYTLPPDIAAKTEHVVHVCAGSGSVPNLSILKFALANHPNLRHTFIYSNKTWEDVIFRETLAELAAQYPDRLTVVHTLTRETDDTRFGPSVRKGRINEALLRELIPDPQSCFVYLCGPGISKWDREAAREANAAPQPKFIEMALTTLRQIGVPDSRIKRESYG